MYVSGKCTNNFYNHVSICDIAINDLIKNIYPESDSALFDIPPNRFDKKYINGLKRRGAILKGDVYLTEKEEIKRHLDKIFYKGPVCFQKILPSEANNPRKSWETVISGKRPLGQFSVDTLYSPVLHALSELPDVGIKIYPKEGVDFLYMVVIYNKKFNKFNDFVDKYMQLYNKKRELMDELVGSYELRCIESELIVAKELGEVFYYSDESINDYLNKLKNKLIVFRGNQVISGNNV